MPLTPNGKLDRKALPTPTREEKPLLTNHPPETELERAIAEIWQDLLQKPSIGVQSEFFDLGGDSWRSSAFSRASKQSSADPHGRRARRRPNNSRPCASAFRRQSDLREVRSDSRASATRRSSAVFLPSRHRRRHPTLDNLAMHMGTHRPFLAVRRDPNAPLTDTLPRSLRVS